MINSRARIKATASFLYRESTSSASMKYNLIWGDELKYGIFNIVSKSTLLVGSADSMFNINCLRPYEIDDQNFVICTLDGKVYNCWKYYFWSLGSKNSLIYCGRLYAVYWSTPEDAIYNELFPWIIRLELFALCDLESDFFFFSSFLFDTAL